MGTVLPSGMVAVAAPAVTLTTCWPKPVAAAMRRNALPRTAAFSVVFDLESLIRIIVVSRSRCVLDMQPDFVFTVRRGSAGRGAQTGGRATHSLRLPLVRFVNRKFPRID